PREAEHRKFGTTPAAHRSPSEPPRGRAPLAICFRVSLFCCRTPTSSGSLSHEVKMPSVPNNVSTQNQQSGGGRKAHDDRRNQQSRQWILHQRRSLPIASVEKRIVEEVKKNDTLIVVGETGSGKTTQLPQFLYSAGFCHDGRVIGITQPRRVAAVTVAKRVAEECNVELGQRVGYSIRFEDVTSSSTRIKYMTDGLLLREALLDPYLSRYSIIIVDEAHERTVHTDVLLGLLKNVQLARSNSIVKQHNCGDVDNDGQDHNQTSTLRACQALKYTPLKLIIMSASLDARGFSEYFGGAKAVYVQGRQYPVEILYTYQPEKDYPDATLITIFQIHIEEGPGDILAFLTGQEEIESMDRLIHERVRQLPEGSNKLITVPIYSSLPSEQQMNVFKPAPSGFRKVILATNIAETSVTIPGIKYVIDPGWVKVRSYNPVTGMESLTISEISKAQALQRSGRAGREGPGKCFRLYTESAFSELKDSTVPEIKRCNLVNVVLQLKALGIDDILGFDFMEKPSRTAIVKSLEQLLLQGALTDECKLSDPVGDQMARLPLDPMYSKALIVASEFKCLEEMLIAVSMLSVESIFYSPCDKMEEANAAKKRFSSPKGPYCFGECISGICGMLGEKQKCKDERESGGKGSKQMVQGELHQLPCSKACSRCSQVILATNIAETSVTIPVVVLVGGPREMFRLYTESAFSELKDSTVPEIKRCNLVNVVLQLKALGIDDILGLISGKAFKVNPDIFFNMTAIVKSLEQLLLQGALTDECKLSDPVGDQMARLPLDPMYSKALIANAAKKRFSSPEGDHIALVNVYRASAECLEKSKNAKMKEKAVEKALNKWCRENFINYRALRHARDVHSQIKGHVEQMGLVLSSCGDDMLHFRRCLTASFFLNAARREPDRSYRTTASGQSVHIHPSSVLSEIKPKPDCIIFNELVYTTQNYVRNVTRIDPLWLPELAPQYYAAES
ncbi:ATP-dependent RNA helicase DHX8, partial [Ananas comosus]